MAAKAALKKAASDRDFCKLLLESTISKIENHATNPLSIHRIEFYIKETDKHWEKFNESHDKILGAEPENIENENGIFIEVYYLYEQAKCKLADLHTSLSPAPATTTVVKNENSNSPAHIKLPRINLPTFSGENHEWISFRDMFITAIHSNGMLSEAQKLTYLQSSLTGNAARLIKSLSISNENYNIAWDTIKRRYENKRELYFTIINRLVSFNPITTESPEALRKLVDSANECIRGLDALNIEDLWDAILLFMLTQKLDSNSRQFWELSLKDTEIPSSSSLLDFIEQRARSLAAATITKPRSQDNTQQHYKKVNSFNISTNNSSSTSYSCKVCSQQHFLFKCPDFNSMDVNERRSTVAMYNLCFNCLRDGHRSIECKNKNTCTICKKKHHSLLHFNQESSAQEPGPSSEIKNHHANGYNQTLLATARLRIHDTNGKAIFFRALLDGGSTASFISEKCIKLLGLSRQKTDAEVIGISSSSICKTKGKTQIKIFPHFQDWRNESFNVNVYILPQVTGNLPANNCNTDQWTHLNNLNLADPSFFKPAEVDILLGADIFFNLLLKGKRNGSAGTPTAIYSKLGWLVSGTTNAACPQLKVHHFTLEENIQRFWEVENIPKQTILTKEEKECEDIYMKTHSRDPTGRYVVSIPFKKPEVNLGNSRDIAVKRLQHMERKFLSQPKLKELYCEFMSKYETLGHMKKITNINSNANRVFIPHHYVMKDWNNINKFRVVFDASAKTTSGFSLNEAQLVGPTVQDTLLAILSRFRIHVYAFTADVTKMYRQILVNEDQQDFQCILWRKSIQEPIEEFKLRTVTYGTASAPYLATRTLNQLASDEAHRYPVASKIAKRDFYVDDVMSGEDTKENAIEAINQLIKMTDSCGFPLRKFASNNSSIISHLPAEYLESSSILSLDEETVVKTLGLNWNTKTDEFYFKVNQQQSLNKLTKRNLLSEISKIFDPMGWLAPVIINSKILMQEIWKENVGWDEVLPESIIHKWEIFSATLFNIENMKIRRCIIPFKSNRLEFHGFCDASEKAYAACVYVRVISSSAVSTSLLLSKTKVAPLKVISLPRLELCGAALLVDLLELIQDSLHLDIASVTAWTDSSIVLAWLNSAPTRWKTFVANRVSKIQEFLPAENWFHVNGKENPADCASRGISVNDLLTHSLWWNGPEWLSSNHNLNLFNANHHEEKQSLEVLSEEKPVILTLKTSVQLDSTIFTRFSTLLRLRRVTAWIMRFYNNTRSRIQNRRVPASKQILTGPLTVLELEFGLLLWIKLMQALEFTTELSALQNQMPLSKNSKILALSPFIEETTGLLRVGGRLKNSSFAYNKKFPILIPRHHRLTELIIREAHVNNLHAGCQLVHSIISSKYWIVRARDAIRHQLKKCMKCAIIKAETLTQQMGNLPKPRLEYSQPFITTGIDYAGPFTLRAIPGRSKVHYKAYIALFVCFVTKALHLEIVSALTTEACIAAIRRFTGRRGKPNTIYSDCGTNFVGASKELNKLTKSSTHNNVVQDVLSADGITWKFNPPGSPHMGGLWEAGVKSVKYHLHRVVGQTPLTYEEFNTIIIQIEGCLNSRPLMPMSSDANDLDVLTPAHFLIGGPMKEVPDPDLAHLKFNQLGRWQLVQRMKQDIQRRWTKEYITRLQQRPKWMAVQKNIAVGDLVLVKTDDQPSIQWPLARVMEIHPGTDGLTRVVTVKTRTGVMKRNITKLCLLPLDDQQ